MSRVTTLVSAAFAATPFALLALQQPAKMTPLDAQRATEVRTTFKAHCVTCHSSDNPAAGLDLSTPAGIQKGGVSGKLFVAGKPAESLILTRLRGEHGKPRMPLGMTSLTEPQIRTISEWIASGGRTDAPDRPHWAYVKPKRPNLPKTSNSKWVKNPIDAFVLARLEKEKLKPSPEASRETLIRRVSLDLIGLPPTVEEVEAFKADKRPDAYERLVDRLLASPHYGERQARVWLDLGRYADTDGYEKDLGRTAWKWRDWLIKALNRNMPFDQFTIEQIAGDQLPNPTIDQLVATGFHRNTMMNLEGGVDPDEQHFNVVIDRVSTTSTVWLGSTLQCARCHDHKYDPLSQKDFYRMAAFFANSATYPKGTFQNADITLHEPNIEVPSPQQLAEKTKLKQEVAAAQREATKWTPELREAYEQWVAAAKSGSAWKPVPATFVTAEKAIFRSADGFIVQAAGDNALQESYKISSKVGPIRATGLRIEALADPSLPSSGPGRSQNGNFVITNVLLSLGGKPVKFSTVTADFSQRLFPAADALGNNPDKGWAVDGQTGKSHELVLEFAEPVDLAAESDFALVIDNKSKHAYHNLGRFRISLTDVKAPASLTLSPDIRAALAANDRPKLEKFFLDTTPLLAQPRARFMAATQKLKELQAKIPTAMIMRDKPGKGPLATHVRERGEFLTKGELVTAGAPTVLPQIAVRDNPRRLDLARWLVSRDNPLTARVQVNRSWEQVFGRGIVETSEDFGTQSSPPSHPELLDWLAVEFMKDWDMKRLNRLIVTSATYRQSSKANSTLLAKDPSNALLARGPRFRMEAETIRDTVLAASGLLTRKIGGPSVYPYQPDGVWDTPYSGESWKPSKDGDQYRRGIYTYWKRTAPYASFMALDATSREECSVRRTRTNTPLQALALLNDQGMFDAARALGVKMKGPIRNAIAYGFEACTARKPSQAELTRLEKLYGTLKARYAEKPEDAKKIAATPDEAARTMIANVLLNLDETVTKA
jgi:mono/diheme cytochrome c family protein